MEVTFEFEVSDREGREIGATFFLKDTYTKDSIFYHSLHSSLAKSKEVLLYEGTYELSFSPYLMVMDNNQSTITPFYQVVNPSLKQYFADVNVIGVNVRPDPIIPIVPDPIIPDPIIPDPPQVLNLSKNQNYIYTKSFTNDLGTISLDQVQYFDGLGRPTEVVQVRATPSKADLVSYQEYDGFGRENNGWLPVALAGNNGAYADLTKIKSNINTSYPSEASPYSKPVYEASPLNRIIEQYGPGADWHTKGKSIKTEYLTNTATNGILSCINFSVTGSLLTTVLNKKVNYGVGQLYVTKMSDEDNNQSYEFKDKLGQVVLTRQMLGTTQHDTYYIYDDFSNLCYVLPPLAVDKLTNYSDANEIMKQYVYIYKYDSRNRCISKKIPGIDPIYYIYDCI